MTALGDIDLLVLLIATPFISTRNRGRLPFCQRLLSSGRVELAIGSYLGLAFCRLSALGFGHIQIYIQAQGFQKGYTRGRFIGRFPKVLDICMYFCASLLNLFHDSREKGGGVVVAVKHKNKKDPSTRGTTTSTTLEDQGRSSGTSGFAVIFFL